MTLHRTGTGPERASGLPRVTLFKSEGAKIPAQVCGLHLEYTDRATELLLLKAVIMRIQGCLALSSLNLRATFNPFPLSETCLGSPGQASPHVDRVPQDFHVGSGSGPLLGGKGSPLCRGRAQLQERSHLSRLYRGHRATQIHYDWGPELWPQFI